MIKYLNKSILVLCLVFIGSSYALGQQQPLFTQYAFNAVALNPAVAGTHQGVSLTGISRLQWSGLDGAPKTSMFTAHAPIGDKNMGVGITVMNDRIGVASENEIGLLYSYNIQFEKSTLSFGLRGNFDFLQVNYSEVDLGGVSDPNFQGGDLSDFKMNFGAGVYYFSERYFAGVSVPYLTSNTFTGDEGDLSFQKDQLVYIMGGYVFDLSPEFKLKPYTNLTIPIGAPMALDINTSLIYLDQFYLGAGWRPKESFSILFEWQIKNKFRFGYAADLYTGDTNQLGQPGQEFMINYLIPIKKDEVVNPRYF